MTSTAFIDIHSHKKAREENCFSVRNIHANFSAIPSDELVSLGIHPWYIKEETSEKELLLIQTAAANHNVVAIGECGLDKLSAVNFELQKNIFIAQLKIAEQVKKPVIIHCVKAFEELIRIKKGMNIHVPMIVHGYNNNGQILEQLIKNNFYISLGKALLVANSNASVVISKIPIEKLFLETDDGDVSIKSIFERASVLLKLNKEGLIKKIDDNFKNVFKK